VSAASPREPEPQVQGSLRADAAAWAAGATGRDRDDAGMIGRDAAAHLPLGIRSENVGWC
jgi:hypothetical protein